MKRDRDDADFRGISAASGYCVGIDNLHISFSLRLHHNKVRLEVSGIALFIA
jgi:hypothetical protein